MNGYVIGLNLPYYISVEGDLTDKVSEARLFRTRNSAQLVADKHEERSGLEYFVDKVKDGKIVPIPLAKKA